MMRAPWPVFVVSLTDATERRAPLLRDLAALGLAAEVVPAVDGRRGLGPAEERAIDRAAAAARVGRPLSDREFACALSHRSVYARIFRDGLPGAVVLEDDARLTARFLPFLCAGGHLAADLVQMDHQDARVWRRPRARIAGVALYAVAANASLTTGYCVSARGARVLFEASAPLAGLADWPIDVTALGAVVTLPRVVDHPPITVATSEIEVERARLRDSAPALPRWRRFGRRNYWSRWWLKRRTRKVS